MKQTILLKAITAVILLCISCTSRDMKETKHLQIQAADLSTIADANYYGEYSYSNFTYKVEVCVKDHRITAVNVLQNRNTPYAKKAEGVIDEIIRIQTNDVDTISGATTTSKAFLKAIENALLGQG